MFRTELKISEKKSFITHQTPVFSVGSCFAEVMGSKLENYKFSVLCNPFGTIFSPLSIFKIFKLTLNQDKLWEEGFLKNNDHIWFHYDFHSDIKSLELETLKQTIQDKIDEAQKFVAHSEIIIITLGTAWVYKHIASNQYVANCHKVPQHQFEKVLLSVDEVCQDYDKIASFLENKQIILTVSPVRHIKDTLSLNSVSKSVLRLACHYLQEKYENIIYFPAYEIVNDDLRDYRFYTEDMLHITAQAENYIWEKFTDAFMPESTLSVMNQWNYIQKKLNHKPYNPASESHQKFLKQTLKDLEQMQNYMNLENEIKLVKEQIIEEVL
jgi:GSCFA family